MEPKGEGWEILADGQKADLRKKAAKQVTVAAHSGLLMGRRISEGIQAVSNEEKSRNNLELRPA